MAKPLPPPTVCANCGEPIPRNARACPACGADERTGWRETSIYDGLDLPDDDSEGGVAAPGARRPGSLPWYGVVVMIVLLLVLGLGAIGLLP